MGRRRGRPWESTLLCVIKALQGLHILVELQNDIYIRGLLDDCDDAMNVTVKDASLEDVEGRVKKLPLVFVRGSNIRFVHIPESLNVSDAVEEMRLLQDKVALAYTGGKGGPSSKGGEPSTAGSAEV
ncbi:hypothetical protein GOP47_0017343 [Adiantum capillus-veneris]|uniref:Sm domain-containing protein n=1 Tax=Adiantum capillus-veneris TaxID=13818 RepID=A0A9D4UF96_ADICA|nr:hypothetical protein GOP47_0017343 [Adiantum capillus-veneris]